jgi:hypothetical protein
VDAAVRVFDDVGLVPRLFDRIPLPLRLAAPLNAMSSSKRMQVYFAQDPLIGRSWRPALLHRRSR